MYGHGFVFPMSFSSVNVLCCFHIWLSCYPPVICKAISVSLLRSLFHINQTNNHLASSTFSHYHSPIHTFRMDNVHSLSYAHTHTHTDCKSTQAIQLYAPFLCQHADTKYPFTPPMYCREKKNIKKETKIERLPPTPLSICSKAHGISLLTCMFLS